MVQRNWHNFSWDIISKPPKTICKTLYNIFAIMSIILWVISSNRQQNVVKTVVWKLHIEKSNIVDTSNIGCAWHTAVIKKCQVYLWSQIVIVVILNTVWTDVLLSRVAAVTLVFKKPKAQIGSLFLWEWLRLQQDLLWVSPKMIGEIVNSWQNNLLIEVHKLKGDISCKNLFEVCL